MRHTLSVVTGIALLAASACNRVGTSTAEANGTPVATAAPEPPPPAPPPMVTLRRGETIPVRLEETLDTRRNRSGDRFRATLDEPLVSGDRVVIPKGTLCTGHITQAKPSGRFKGRAVLALSLDSIELDGRTYPIGSSSSSVSRGHKLHNWTWIGGSSGGGAAIGAAAGGGPGALIGAGAGAVAGTVGAAVTGKRQITLPVESRVSFVLRSDVTLGG